MIPRNCRSASCLLAISLILGGAAPARHGTGGTPAGVSSLPPAGPGQVGFPQHPCLTPDERFIVFSWLGDLWSVPTEGGAATRLTSHPAEERQSAFSPDGSLLAFESDREGARNLYLMQVRVEGTVLLGGSPRRLTVSDSAQALAGFSADGSDVLFSSLQEPTVYREARMYRAAVAGGPVFRISDAFGQVSQDAPDGSGILFSRGNSGFERPRYRGSGTGDIYRLNRDGTFLRLTSLGSNESEPFQAADGSVVFLSSRDEQNNIWRLAKGWQGGPADASSLTQLTAFKPAPGEFSIAHGVRDLSVSRAGKRAVFCVWDRLYTLDLEAPTSTPREVTVWAAMDAHELDTRRMNLAREVSEAAMSPDGKTVALVARGEVYVRSTEEGRPTRRVTETPWRERDLAWSPDGRVLYFASDSEENYSIFAATVSLAREDLEPVKPPAGEDKPAEEPAAAPPEPAAPQEPDPAVEPAAPAPDDPADQPAGPAADQPEVQADQKPLERKKTNEPDHGKRWAESLRFAVEPVIASQDNERSPIPSPDGKKLLFIRSRGDLYEHTIETGAQRRLVASWNQPDAIWAGDSRHIIYSVQDLYFNSDIWLLDTLAEPGTPAAEPVNLSRHPDADVMPRLSADGKVLVFLSDRAGENFDFDAWAVSLDRRLDGLRPYELDQHFKDAAAAAKKRKPLGGDAPAAKEAKGADKPDAERKDDGNTKEKPPSPENPLEFDAADAYLRVRRVTSSPGPENNLAITAGGDRIIFTTRVDDAPALVSVDHKGGDRKTIVTGGGGAAPGAGGGGGGVSNVSVNLTGERVLYVRSGEAGAAPVAGGKTDSYSIDAPVVIDTAAEQRQKFLEAARILGEEFYHPTLKGLDWDALTRRYAPLAMQTRTPAEFNRVVQFLFGELNGSHTGISGGGGFSAPGPGVGMLGVDVVPGDVGWKITRVIDGLPASQKPSRLNEGETIVAIDGRSPAADVGLTDLNAALAGKSGQETLLEVRTEAGEMRRVLITPATSGVDSAFRYRDEVRRRAAEVDRLSNGRLGYLHIRSMSEPAVRDYERDLYAAAAGKDGLVIDVRDNGGGSTADILLASLTAPRHAVTVPRGADPATVPFDAYPRDRRLIYAYQRPISVLINENSFSNAEIFAHAIKTIGRGRLFGVPTFGGVISTGSATLIDGSRVRTPGRGWYLPDGTDMEITGAIPDVQVVQRPEDEAAGRDPQLEAAVSDLMSRIDAR